MCARLIEQILGNLKNSLCPLLFADFDKFLLHQAAQIQTDALLIYRMTWVYLRMMHLPDADGSAGMSSVGVNSEINIMR